MWGYIEFQDTRIMKEIIDFGLIDKWKMLDIELMTEFLRSKGVFESLEDYLGMNEQEVVELLKKLEISHLDDTSDVSFSFDFETEQPYDVRPYKFDYENLYDFVSVLSLAYPDEIIFVEVYDDYADFREHCLVSDGDYEIHDASWTYFDIEDWEDFDRESGTITLSFSHIDYEIDKENYDNSTATYLYMSDPIIEYRLSPIHDPMRIDDEDEDEEEE